MTGGRAEDFGPYDEVSVEELYARFTREIITAQTQNIPYKLVRSEYGGPSRMTDNIKCKSGLKRGVYKRTKREANFRDRYF